MKQDPGIYAESYAYFDEKAPIFYLIMKPDGQIVHANRYAKELTGRPLKGDNFNDVIVDFTEKIDLTALAGGSDEERILSTSSASKSPLSFYFTFKPFKDFILVFGRQDEEELEKMRNEVLALNRDLNNLTRQLHKRNAKLKCLNDEKNRFIGMAAHDLRKPIGLVMNYSEFIIEEAEDTLDPEHFGFLNTIKASSTFMKRLVDDFLDVSAIEAGKFDLDLQPAAILDVLQNSLRLNNHQAEKKKIQLQISSDENIPRMIMDASRIEQIITNIVSNAIEHSPPDSDVDIAVLYDQNAITFSVRDEGPGIPEKEQKNLFKPFGKTSIKKIGGEKSTGLGLLIARKIIEAHSGKIWIESQVGKGTTVSFILPN